MSEAAPALEVTVEGAPEHSGVRVDHPILEQYAKNGFKLGYGNEHIVKITGLPGSVVSRLRSQHDKEEREKAKK